MAAVAPKPSSSSSTAVLAGAAVGAAALFGAAAYLARRRAREAKEAKDAKDAKDAKVAAEAKAASTQASGPTARIVALASAFPPNKYSHSQFLTAFLRNHAGLPAKDEDFVQRVWKGADFDSSSSYLEEKDLFRKMSRLEYTAYVKKSLRDLALRSSRDAITQWGGDIQKITHVIFGTMTGSIHSPTMDIEVALELGLNTKIKRLNVEGMGCLTGYRCLGLANDIARADPSHVVLLMVCDIRNALGNQLSPYVAGTPIDKSNVIASSLFRDCGASAIVTSEAMGTVPATESHTPLYEILEHRSALLPKTFDLVKYTERDDAVIHLYIAKELPGAIKAVLRGKVEELLRPYNLSIDDCCYSVHTGGPKVLEYVAESLGISKSRMAPSWYCMKTWGNLSGSSNLVVLDHWRRMPKTSSFTAEPKPYVVCMSFGPGVGMELLLLKATAPEIPK